MYFRNGKLISEKSYRSSVSRRRGTSPKRATRRRSPGTRRKTVARRRRTYRRKPAMPHPSITGMASGLAVASYLNSGTTKFSPGSGVIKDLTGGALNKGFSALSKNAIDLATSDSGKKVLSTAIVLATAGGLARKWFPSVKLGGSKFYFKV